MKPGVHWTCPGEQGGDVEVKTNIERGRDEMEQGKMVRGQIGHDQRTTTKVRRLRFTG